MEQTAAFSSAANDDWAYGEGDGESSEAVDDTDGGLPTAADLERMHTALKLFMDRLRDLAAEAKERLQADLGLDLASLAGQDKEAAQDLFEDIVQTLPDFDEFVNDIMDEVRARFGGSAPKHCKRIRTAGRKPGNSKPRTARTSSVRFGVFPPTTPRPLAHF